MSENKEETKVVEEELEEEKEQRVKVTIPHQKIKGVVPQKKMPKQVFNKKPHETGTDDPIDFPKDEEQNEP